MIENAYFYVQQEKDSVKHCVDGLGTDYGNVSYCILLKNAVTYVTVIFPQAINISWSLPWLDSATKVSPAGLVWACLLGCCRSLGIQKCKIFIFHEESVMFAYCTYKVTFMDPFLLSAGNLHDIKLLIFLLVQSDRSPVSGDILQLVARSLSSTHKSHWRKT